MKKLLAAALSVALASSISFAFVACDNDDGKTSNKGGTAPIVSEKVTKDQWESAFTANNFKNGTVKDVRTRKGDLRIDEDTKANGTVTMTTDVVIDGDKQYMTVSYSAKGEKALTDLYVGVEAEEKYTKAYDISDPDYPLYIYYGKKSYYGNDGNGGFSHLIEQDGKVHWDIINHWNEKGLFDKEIEYILELGQYYDAFEYNDAKKGYTAKEEANNKLKGFVLKFKDYKLISMETDEVDLGDYTEKETYTITYGNQTVTLPTMEATTMFDGTWKTKCMVRNVTGDIIEIGEEVGSYGNWENKIVLAADTLKFTLKNDGTATYTHLNTTNPCIWAFYKDETVDLFSNSLPEDAHQWRLDYDKDSQCLTLDWWNTGYTIYLEKEAA